MTGRWSVVLHSEALQSVALQLGETCNLGRRVSQPKGFKMEQGRRNRLNSNGAVSSPANSSFKGPDGAKAAGVELVGCALRAQRFSGGSPWLPAELKAMSWG
jgi:hypothetical protein